MELAERRLTWAQGVVGKLGSPNPPTHSNLSLIINLVKMIMVMIIIFIVMIKAMIMAEEGMKLQIGFIVLPVLKSHADLFC